MFDLTDVKEHEKFFILRRRSKVRSEDMAKLLGLSPCHYSIFESKGIDLFVDKNKYYHYLLSKIETVKYYEYLVILRKRYKVKQRYIIQELGCCRQHMVNMEHGRCNYSDLYSFWVKFLTEKENDG